MKIEHFIQNPFPDKETHEIIFWIKPSRSKIFSRIMLPMKSGDITDAENLLVFNLRNLGHNPWQNTGSNFFQAHQSIISNLLEELDYEFNKDFGIYSITVL